MNISDLGPKDVLEEGAFEEYDKGIGFFFSELVQLNAILYLAEKIVNFPFDLFASRDNTIFFTIVMDSFYDSAILTITRLTTDQKGDLFTLPRFKNRVRDLVKPEFREAFDVYLAEARFDNGVIRLLTRVKDLRTHRIAHITRDFVSGNVKLFRPNLLELVELRNALNSLLNALAFNVEYQMLPIPYDDRVLRSNRSAIKTDIEEILDCIAKNSFYLHMPER
jgi:hypothetical protein